MLKKYLEAYEILCRYSLNQVDKRSTAELRRKHIAAIKNESKPIIKNAIDTRHFDQQNTYNPRRALQMYHRSEEWIDAGTSEKIKRFFKIKTATDSIKNDFLGDQDWLDSYARVLSQALDRTLRTDQKDFDYSKAQMEYLEELMYLRYRIAMDDVDRLDEKQIKGIIIQKDQRLAHKEIYANYDAGISRHSTGLINNAAVPVQVQVAQAPDQLIERLFGNIKATQQNKNVKRSVNITIEDSIVDPEIKVEAVEDIEKKE